MTLRESTNGSLTVLGIRAGSPDAFSPASGYLITSGETTILVDCGPGVIAAAAAVTDLSALSGVVISHRHADHAADLVALAFHRAFPRDCPPLALVAPTGFGEVLSGLDGVWGIPTLTELATPLSSAFDLCEVPPGESFELAGLGVDTARGEHPVPTICTRWRDLDFAYTADTGYSDRLVEWARDVGTLMAEATYLDADARDMEGHGHLTGTLAGRLATESGAGRLVLTHFADSRDRGASGEAARGSFAGDVQVAEPGLVVTLGS